MMIDPIPRAIVAKMEASLDRFAEFLAEEFTPAAAALRCDLPARFGEIMLSGLRRRLGPQAA